MRRFAAPVRCRARGRARRADAGTTLVELLVVMAMVGVLGPIVIRVLMSGFGSAQGVLGSADGVGSTRTALASVDKQVRSANLPLTVTATTLSMTTCADQTTDQRGTVRVVEFRFSGGRLQTRSHLPSATPGAWATVATGLAASSGFAAAGQGVQVTAATDRRGAVRAASGSTVVVPRNPALPSPLPTVC